MKIIIVGCGKIGKTIISSLLKENHDVLAMDINPAVVEEVTNVYDVMGICGNGTEYETLKEAGVDKADIFVAATNSDEVNMLSCYVAHCMHAKHTIARIRNSGNNSVIGLAFMKKQLSLSLSINPELQAAKAIYNIIKLPSATKVEMFSSNRFEMIELVLKEESHLDGMTLIDLRKNIKQNFLVCAVSRDGKVYIPQGNFKLKNGDKIGIIASGKDAPKLLKAFGVQHKPVHNVIIIGAGKTSTYLAEMLVEDKIGVNVIEIDEKRCTEMCEKVPSATVIHGNGMSQDVLLEEGVETVDAFVALTGRDEENILISFYAMSQKNPKVICKVNGEELSDIAEDLGLECIISPKKIIADIIVQYARALKNSEGSKVEMLYSLLNGQIEALEFNVLPDFEFCNIPLKRLKFKDNVLLAGIVRGTETIIPNGEDSIIAGDRVIIIAVGKTIYTLGDAIKETAK